MQYYMILYIEYDSNDVLYFIIFITYDTKCWSCMYTACVLYSFYPCGYSYFLVTLFYFTYLYFSSPFISEDQ